MLERTRPVLDAGYIELLDLMGDESRIVKAARITTQTQGQPESDRRLLERLLRDGHNTVFEPVHMSWQVRCPIFVARQWMRHRIGTFNERSLRYTTIGDEDTYYNPFPSDSPLAYQWDLQMQSQFATYGSLLNSGVRPEVARGVLGTALYTEFMWTVDLWSWTNWYRKRCAPSAQAEHREYAQASLDLLGEKMPVFAQALLRIDSAAAACS